MSDVHLLRNIPLVICAKYNGSAWTDPWGKTESAFVVNEIEFDLMDTGRRLQRDVGYGPQNMATDLIWITNNGAFMRQFMNPIDYHGGSHFRYCDEHGVRLDGSLGELSFEQPALKRRYVMDGSPWLPDLAISALGLQ